MLTVGSLFSGIGGMDLGLERVGMKVIWQSEIDNYASKVLKKHWPNVPNLGDITKIDWSGIERPDVIAGGFPCQDISYAGKGEGIHGKRSGLFFELMRCVREVGPRIVVLENVAALLHRGMGEVLGELASCGYDAEWHCIPAAAVGAPHIRDRVFVVAYANSKRLEGTEYERQRSSVGAWISNDGANVANTASDGWQQGQQDDGGCGERIRARKEYRPGDSGGWWATEPDVGRVAHGVSNRVDRLRGLGNAVVPQVAEWIGRQIIASVNDQIEHGAMVVILNTNTKGK